MTLPNFITIGRFLAVPVILYALLHGYVITAFILFLLAGLSDAVDGAIARYFNQRSTLGAWLDPLADKLLLVSVFVVLGTINVLPDWLVFLVVSRDVLIIGAVILSSLMGSPMEADPLMISKANTAAQIMLVVLALAQLAFAFDYPILFKGMIVITSVLTLGSAASYLVVWFKHMNDRDVEPGN
jgi:cardiolipin synthase